VHVDLWKDIKLSLFTACNKKLAGIWAAMIPLFLHNIFLSDLVSTGMCWCLYHLEPLLSPSPLSQSCLYLKSVAESTPLYQHRLVCSMATFRMKLEVSVL